MFFLVFSIAFDYNQRSIVKNEALTMRLVSMGQHILEIMEMFYSYDTDICQNRRGKTVACTRSYAKRGSNIRHVSFFRKPY